MKYLFYALLFLMLPVMTRGATTPVEGTITFSGYVGNRPGCSITTSNLANVQSTSLNWYEGSFAGMSGKASNLKNKTTFVGSLGINVGGTTNQTPSASDTALVTASGASDINAIKVTIRLTCDTVATTKTVTMRLYSPNGPGGALSFTSMVSNDSTASQKLQLHSFLQICGENKLRWIDFSNMAMTVSTIYPLSTATLNTCDISSYYVLIKSDGQELTDKATYQAENSLIFEMP